MTSIQRRSLQKAGGAMGLTVAVTTGSRMLAERGHPSAPVAIAVALISLLPIVYVIAVAAKYLASEQDEFIRMLVVRAMLWGFAVTMAGDAIVGFVSEFSPMHLPLSLLNADLFFAGTGIAFRLLQRRYR
ncbi:MAG TPA: hypothetical protein VGD59_04060 [Acidisarcina sp.]